MIIQIFTAIVAGVAPFFFPALGFWSVFSTDRQATRWSLAASASIVSWALVSFFLASAGIPQLATAIILASLTIVVLVWAQLRRDDYLHYARYTSLFLLLLAAFLIPFFGFHRGLPTGDSQKAILWSQNILQSNSLPEYEKSLVTLNRDPVDFYTPALHTLTASVSTLSPDPLTTVGVFSIGMGVATAMITVALAQVLAPKLPSMYLIPLVLFLTLSQLRFLRYLREPGYHFQNLAGELLLFTLMLCGLLLVRSWRWRVVVLGVSCGVALILSHQFSSFIAVFAVAPIAVLVLAAVIRAQHIRTVSVALGGIGMVVIGVIGGMALDLHIKIPHIFTANPHLLPLTASWSDYPRLMGIAWISIGGTGLVWLLAQRDRSIIQRGFGVCVVVLILLSQAPHLGIDIPPVRALFYLAIPLSVCAAVFIGHMLAHTSARFRILGSAAVIIVGIGGVGTLTQAFELSHTVRTNSTLTPAAASLVSNLQSRKNVGPVLVDDYNRRSSSWLALAGNGMYTRIAADIARQAQESSQSETRRDLYFNQLLFEKIYSLSSDTFAAELADVAGLSHVVGITNSSTSGFAANKALREVTSSNDLTLFETAEVPATNCSLPAVVHPWVEMPSTLVNTFGDDEDTFKHLPISIRSHRLSGPVIQAGCPARITTADQFLISANAHAYVASLWDQDNDYQTDSGLDVYIGSSSHTSLQLQNDEEELITVPTNKRVRLDNVRYISEEGFLELNIRNAGSTPVAINSVVLGLSRVP